MSPSCLNKIDPVWIYIWIHRNWLSHLHIFREEMKKVMTMSYIGGSFEGFFFTSAKLVVFLILLSYVMVGGTITVKKVYLMVTLVQIITFSTTLFIPFAFRFGFEILVTLRRYQVCVQFFVSFWFRNCFLDLTILLCFYIFYTNPFPILMTYIKMLTISMLPSKFQSILWCSWIRIWHIV